MLDVAELLIYAGLAQGNGRGGMVWFLVSLLLGPPATLILVLLPVGDQATGRP